VNELFSALNDLFDELNQMDDGSPMSAQTPTEYTIGIIDTGDDDPWFIDRVTTEHLTGGAITTANWARTASNTGIVRVHYNAAGATAFSTTDIGLTVTHTGGDSGTLLDYVATGTSGYAWIRPATVSTTNDWDSTSSSINVTGGTGASVAQLSVSETGESLFANIFSIGTQEENTTFYVKQNSLNLGGYKTGVKWWLEGALDILVPVKEVDVEIDEAVVTVFGRQYSKTYDHFETDLTAGGRNPIPLATGDNIDNETGYRQVRSSAVTGVWSTGDAGTVIREDGNNNNQAVITKVSGTSPVQRFDYYLIGTLTGFTSSMTLESEDEVRNFKVDSDDPIDVGPASVVSASIAYTSDETIDIDEDGITENYSIVIDCGGLALADVYEWGQYQTRRGSAVSTHTDGIPGEFYIGIDYRLAYTEVSGTVSEGQVALQASTGATGTILSHNTTDSYVMLRDSRGTFNVNNRVSTATGVLSAMVPTVITPNKSNVFGNFAGGTWFLARGVTLINVPAADANNFQATTDEGLIVAAPTKVTITIGNSREFDRIAVFRLVAAGGQIFKSRYNIASATVSGIGVSTLPVTPSIFTDEPGRTTGGVVFVVDQSADQEHRYRFTSHTSNVFTLFTRPPTGADAGGANSSTLLEDTGANFSTNAVLVGDIIYSSTNTAFAYVENVVSETQLSTTNLGFSWSSNNYAIGVVVAAYDSTDTAYVPIIHKHETVGSAALVGSETETLTYVSNIPIRARARQKGDIQPYEADGTITNTGFNTNIIRTPDTIST
jgi:hypothetical protein